MRLFACPSCGQRVYFENSACLGCQASIGFDPGSRTMLVPEAQAGLVRCSGGDPHCNWLVTADQSDGLQCRSCRLTTVRPTDDDAGEAERWARLEQAKRRLLWTLQGLGLPIDGLRFSFPAKGMTGHADGLITVVLGEADDVERERLRIALGEPYRTVMGHLRHESGHFYWDVLVKESGWLAPVRELFGDDRLDYQAALAKHYKDGPAPDWHSAYLSAYATSHPWEDWAETWAHYLHMTDATEIATSYGFSLAPSIPAGPAVPTAAQDSFSALMDEWLPLTTFGNSLNRSIGFHDWYPFTLADPSVAKLRLIHRVIHETAPALTSPAPMPVVSSPPPVASNPPPAGTMPAAPTVAPPTTTPAGPINV